MSEQSPSLAPQETEEPQSKVKLWLSRAQFLLLFVVYAAPLIGAYYLYSQRDTKNFSTVNNGEFYSQPQDLSDVPLMFEDGVIKTFNSLEKKWYLLVVIDGACDAVCEENLLMIRQVRRMQGKNINRVVSMFVHANLDLTIANDLAAKYSLTAVAADPAQFNEWQRPFYEGRGEQKFDHSRIYVVDPLKKLMMSYPAGVEPKGVYKDLKRLLKVSQIG